jgi:methionyl-tRNA formyltransferase
MSRLAFLGTPGAAVPTLRALTEHHDVAVVITQPDRPKGRSRTPTGPPVKDEAARLGLEVRQPTKAEEISAVLGAFEPLDLAVVVAYGRLLSLEALDVPDHGMLNVHFSLLPRWRGAAPVARALLAGDPMTGVTIIRLDEGLDTGPVLTAQAIDIHPEETCGELTSRLALLGARLLTDAVPSYLSADADVVPQTGEGATYAAKLETAERAMHISDQAVAAVNRVRALSPEPGATLRIDGETHQILRARRSTLDATPGTWVAHHDVPIAGFSDGGVELVEVQPPGKRPMGGASWLRGRQRDSGVVE